MIFGTILNINADMSASEIANALGIKKIVYLTDQDGIYDSQGNVLSQVSTKDLERLIEQKIVTDGMLVRHRQYFPLCIARQLRSISLMVKSTV